MPDSTVTVGELTLANHLPLTLIAGPCQMESADHARHMAGALKAIAERLGDRLDRKSTRLNSSHSQQSRMPSSA